jgi:hypothetical protein
MKGPANSQPGDFIGSKPPFGFVARIERSARPAGKKRVGQAVSGRFFHSLYIRKIQRLESLETHPFPEKDFKGAFLAILEPQGCEMGILPGHTLPRARRERFEPNCLPPWRTVSARNDVQNNLQPQGVYRVKREGGVFHLHGRF